MGTCQNERLNKLAVDQSNSFKWEMESKRTILLRFRGKTKQWKKRKKERKRRKENQPKRENARTSKYMDFNMKLGCFFLHRTYQKKISSMDCLCYFKTIYFSYINSPLSPQNLEDLCIEISWFSTYLSIFLSLSPSFALFVCLFFIILLSILSLLIDRTQSFCLSVYLFPFKW